MHHVDAFTRLSQRQLSSESRCTLLERMRVCSSSYKMSIRRMVAADMGVNSCQNPVRDIACCAHYKPRFEVVIIPNRLLTALGNPRPTSISSSTCRDNRSSEDVHHHVLGLTACTTARLDMVLAQFAYVTLEIQLTYAPFVLTCSGGKRLPVFKRRRML